MADLIMLTKGRAFRCVVTNEVDRTYGFEARKMVTMNLKEPGQEIMVEYYAPDSPSP